MISEVTQPNIQFPIKPCYACAKDVATFAVLPLCTRCRESIDRGTKIGEPNKRRLR